MKSIGAKPLVYPTPVFVVGTYDKNDKPNAMTAAWGGICCSKPPAVCIALRKATYTYGNILEKKAFTISIPSEKYAKEADYFGIASGRDTDKFKDTQLTPEKGSIVDAPYVKEFPLVLECALMNHVEIGLHTLFIGEIKDVLADESVIGRDGTIQVDKVSPIMFAPENWEYYGISRLVGSAFKMGKEIANKPR